MAEKILAHIPPHKIYTEVFGGAASVLLRKPRAYAEIYNDLNGEIVNLFQVVRDRGEELIQQLELTPYAREEFFLSHEPAADPIERARRTVVRSFMGFGTNLTKQNRDGSPQRTGFRNYSKKDRRSIPANDWRNLPEGFASIIDRLRGVIIENLPAADVLKKHDDVQACHYVDPPYVHDTRSSSGGGARRAYAFEMSDQDHRALAAVLHGLKGHVVLSGYACDLYDQELYADWQRVEFSALADGAKPRREVLWIK